MSLIQVIGTQSRHFGISNKEEKLHLKKGLRTCYTRSNPSNANELNKLYDLYIYICVL